ncbi:uncharacterized protein LOC122856155 [Aphidius gifuensis]|uniref:uncharacterized protein LOC122856155 n=1 Tax=Aphidius gifuensis TaxID=684658 RepID=UPI001CDBEBFF|nr:uncharacterized protein LOC122856155 [Aphidius gifuensis]
MLMNNLLEVMEGVENALKYFPDCLERDMVIEVLVLLLDCIDYEQNVKCFDWKLAMAIFSGIAKIPRLSSSDLLIKISHYLMKNIECLNEPCVNQNEATSLAQLICVLLENKCQWVLQEAFEMFNNIVEHSTNEKIQKLSDNDYDEKADELYKEH